MKISPYIVVSGHTVEASPMVRLAYHFPMARLREEINLRDSGLCVGRTMAQRTQAEADRRYLQAHYEARRTGLLPRND